MYDMPDPIATRIDELRLTLGLNPRRVLLLAQIFQPAATTIAEMAAVDRYKLMEMLEEMEANQRPYADMRRAG